MSEDRRRRAEAALAEHFRNLLAKGYVPQEFDETLRGADLEEEWHEGRIGTDRGVPDVEYEAPDWSGYWDGITEDYGYTVFEAPEWPKPAKCRRMWGPTNGRFAGIQRTDFSSRHWLSRGLGRIDFPSVVLKSGDFGKPAGAGGRRKSLVSIYQGYKQGMEFLRSAWKECGVKREPVGEIDIVRVADEADVHAIGLARDPMSKVVSAYKEIMYRIPPKTRRKTDRYLEREEDFWWARGEAYPGSLEHGFSCLDWMFLTRTREDWKEGYRFFEWSAREDERFRGYLEALVCGCRYLEWQHAATSTWWMAMRRTVTEARGPDAKTVNAILGQIPPAMANISGHPEVRRTGYATPRIDEVWNTEDMSAEVPRLIERFGIQQDAGQIGKRFNGACEGQAPRTYLGTSEEKDANDEWPTPPSDRLREVLADAQVAEGVCDAFAQDYICFGLEPPRQCAALREMMERYDLVVYEEGYRGGEAAK